MIKNESGETSSQVSSTYLSLQQPRCPSAFAGDGSQDAQKWLKEYKRVAKFNKLDYTMCLANAVFFLGGTARKWFENNEETLTSWYYFQRALGEAFGQQEAIIKEAESLLKNRSQKGVAEDIYQILIAKDVENVNKFLKECRKIEIMRKRRISSRFERLPKVSPMAYEEEDLPSLIGIVRDTESNSSTQADHKFAGIPDKRGSRNKFVANLLKTASSSKEPITAIQDIDEIEPRIPSARQPRSPSPYPGRGISTGRRPSRSPARITIKGTQVLALVDSGADYSVISEDFRRLIKLPMLSERGPITRVANSKCVRALGRCVLKINKNTGVQEVVIACSKTLTLDKQIIIPTSVVSLNHDMSKVWMANGSNFAKIIPAGMLVAEISLIDTGHLCCINGGNDGFETNENRCTEDLNKLVTLIDTDISNEDRVRLLDIIRKYSDVFEFQKSSLKTSSLKGKHHIDTGDHAPIKQRPYRVSPRERSIIQTEVDNMLKLEIIQPSDSPWSSPVVLVEKKDGTWRFCVDYRRLNKITRKDVYPLLRIDDTLDSLRGASIFSTMDLKSGYWQNEVDETDREKTAFVTPDGFFEFRVMPFGLCNAPATFERIMDNILRGLKWTISNLKDTSGRLARWALRLQEYEVTVCYKNGRKHKDADCLSRSPLPDTSEETEEDIPSLAMLTDVEKEQKLDPSLGLPKRMTGYADDFIGQVSSEVFEIMTDIAENASGAKTHLNYHLEIMTHNPLLNSLPENRYRLVGTATGGAVEIAKFILNDIILKHGAPREMITDRGRSFQSKLVNELTKMCGMSQLFTTAYHPQTNGLTERLNKTLGDMLSMYVDVEQKNWDSILPFVTLAYNTAKQETTGFTPFYLVHGREAETMLDTLLPYQPDYENDEYVSQLIIDAEDARQLARLHTLRTQGIDKRRCTDYYSRYIETAALPRGTAEEIADFFLQRVVLRHGPPKTIISDRGSCFLSKLFKQVLKICNTLHKKTTSYHPQTNGQTERMNRTLADMMAMYIDERYQNWDEILPFVTFAYNSSIQDTTGYSPYFLIHGREPLTFLDSTFDMPELSKYKDYDEYERCVKGGRKKGETKSFLEERHKARLEEQERKLIEEGVRRSQRIKDRNEVNFILEIDHYFSENFKEAMDSGKRN
ncbi:K02A2.6-like [Cordylochernes scorpioides]|uniref:K02A2.6-like n=1 Tax=Cordylochernes scorpioides TaxID=51811 RepID=A0ABY6LIE8_9ARAC|nr:K02A2.6-like [Cordylochernes scorpioides]